MAEENQFKDWVDRSEAKATHEFFETNLEYEKYLLDPKSEKVWADLNKDLALGNLDSLEHQAILNQEKTLRGLMGMKEALGHEIIGDLFVPEGLLKLYKRMPAFTLAVSLSKSGFKQKLMRSMTKEQILSTKTNDEIEYKKGWWPKKKKKEGVD
jgi:hypothetical protein|tara:strand:- start:919 stop:1380 length:462 start_codon:yes stop_codon:yes gene_type:complete